MENLKPREDISRLQGLSPEGHRPYLEKSICVFAEPVSMGRVREVVEIAEPLARETAGPAGVPVRELRQNRAKGRGSKGGDGKQNSESERERKIVWVSYCYNCDEKGHHCRDCWHPQKGGK